MGRPVVHWELWSENPEELSEFYSRVFEWDIRHDPALNYRIVTTGGEGGIDGGMKPQQGPWPGNMAFYVGVDDLSAYGERVKEAGGKIVVEGMEVPGVGLLSLFEDPDGRVLGMWQHLEAD